MKFKIFVSYLTPHIQSIKFPRFELHTEYVCVLAFPPACMLSECINSKCSVIYNQFSHCLITVWDLNCSVDGFLFIHCLVIKFLLKTIVYLTLERCIASEFLLK